MKKTNLLVLSRPEPQFSMLEELRGTTNFLIGTSPEGFEPAAADAEVILNWTGSLDFLREVFNAEGESQTRNSDKSCPRTTRSLWLGHVT